MHKLIDHQQQVLGECSPQKTLMENFIQLHISLQNDCSGKGTCGKCKVKIMSGEVSPITQVEERLLAPEELGAGWVLACQRYPLSDLQVFWEHNQDAATRKTDLVYGKQKTYQDPLVGVTTLSLTPPDLRDQQPDWERLVAAAVQRETVNAAAPRLVLQKLPDLLRQSAYTIDVIMWHDTIIDVRPVSENRKFYGFVFDIGTTTIAAYLVDMVDGDVLAAAGATNPQMKYGADVITRINGISENYALLHIMHDRVMTAIKELMRQLSSAKQIDRDDIYGVTLVANTTMSHLAMEIDPRYLAKAPFTPCFKQPLSFKAKEFALPMYAEGEIFVLPNVAGYVGSDTVGVMLATDIGEQDGYTVGVDIGTNGEIILAGNGRILTCSTAAGPAFEGSHIQNGMRAGKGAIEKVRIVGGQIELQIIDQVPPCGICGSGIIDAIAQMYQCGLIDSSGRLIDPQERIGNHDALQSRLRVGVDQMNEFLLVRKGEHGAQQDIVITQKDIRELQLAKGAIAAGIQVLAEEVAIEESQISRVFLAGAFGNYIDKTHAVAIGMFPGIDKEKIIAVGNAAGDGGKMALLSRAKRAQALAMSERAEHIELSTNSAFYQKFMKEMEFPALQEVT